MKTIKKFLPSILIILLQIAIGVLLIIDAEKLTVYVFRLFGFALIVLAVVMTFRYLKARKDDEANLFTLIIAIVAFVLGMVLAIGAEMLVDAGIKLFVIFYGALMIVNGAFKIGEFISLKKQGAAVSAISVFSGVLSVALGVVAIILRGEALSLIGIILGITLLAESVLDVAALFVAHRMDNSGSIYDTSGDDSDYEDD